MAAENRLIEKIKKYVKSKGGKVIKIHQSGFSELGIPDLVITIPNRQTVFVETKALGKKPTPIQYAKIAEINRSGGEAWWCDSYESFMDQLIENSGMTY